MRSAADSFPLVETKIRVVDWYVGVVRAEVVTAATRAAKKMAATSTIRFRTTKRYSFKRKVAPKSHLLQNYSIFRVLGAFGLKLHNCFLLDIIFTQYIVLSTSMPIHLRWIAEPL